MGKGCCQQRSAVLGAGVCCQRKRSTWFAAEGSLPGGAVCATTAIISTARKRDSSGRTRAGGGLRMEGIPMRSAGISTSDRERTGIREGALFLWLFGSRPAGGVKARGRCGNGDSVRLSRPSNSLRVGLGTLRPLKARKSLLLGGNGGTDLPGFPTFRQAPGQSRNPPPIEMLKTPSSRETIGRRRGKAGHAAAAR